MTETHTVTYEGQSIIVTHHNGTRAEIPRTSDVGRELTDALFESLRCAFAREQDDAAPALWAYRGNHGAVVSATLICAACMATSAGVMTVRARFRSHPAYATGADLVPVPNEQVPGHACAVCERVPDAEPTREPVPFDDDPEGDNWAPPGIEEGTEATCRRCGVKIVWGYDEENDGEGNPVTSTEFGWWYHADYGVTACTPGPDDADRYHAPTTTPAPADRDAVVADVRLPEGD